MHYFVTADFRDGRNTTMPREVTDGDDLPAGYEGK